MPTEPTENLGIDRLDENENGVIRHNEGLNILDALVHLAVIDRDLTTPPVDPSNGDRYLVAGSATGDWSGEDGNIASWYDGWVFSTPNPGWIVTILDEGVTLLKTGSGYVALQRVTEPGKITITLPSPEAGDEILLLKADHNLVITKVTGVRSGGTSVDINLRKSTDRSAAGDAVWSADEEITSTTTGDEITSFDDDTVDAGEFLWLEITAVDGAVDQIEIVVSLQRAA